MDIDLRGLRHVAAVAAEGSFVRAARALHMSQSALTRSIQEVERRAGVRLFDRGREGASLTDIGRTFMVRAADVLASADDMGRELSMLKGLASGELHIGAGVFPASLYMGRVLAGLIRPSSEARIRVAIDSAPSLLQRLRRRELDLLVADPIWVEQATDVRVIPLSTRQAHLVVRIGHPLLRESPPTMAEVVSYPLVTATAMTSRAARMRTGRDTKGQLSKKLFMQWSPSVTVDSVHEMKELVRVSDAVTIASLTLVAGELERGELALLPVPVPWIRAAFAVMHLAHRTPTPLAEAFIQRVREEDRRILAEETRLAAERIRPVR